ncbi:hypothetical protein [Sedimenticola hydrogenitrophicus]|uniref:hypothetical protein n=1 Tax=Sedimenticola hydrogenitrophicus TaxID=2967975 RepID=UPI0023B1CDB4|nr:hypothetical protein [Sedimenticola hydrogenitrophicus]
MTESVNESAQDVVLSNFPPERRETLLRWASTHQVHPDDPIWSLVDQAGLLHEWQLESVRELETAQRSATARIHQTSLAATRSLRQAALVAREEVPEGLGDEVRQLMADETRRALSRASRGTWLHKIAHWVGPALLGLMVASGTAAWLVHNQPSREDLNLAQGLKKAWPRLPASAQQVIREALK